MKRSFLVCRYTFKLSRYNSYIKVIRLRSRSQEQKSVSVCSVGEFFDFDWKALLLVNLWGHLPDAEKAGSQRKLRCLLHLALTFKFWICPSLAHAVNLCSTHGPCSPRYGTGASSSRSSWSNDGFDLCREETVDRGRHRHRLDTDSWADCHQLSNRLAAAIDASRDRNRSKLKRHKHIAVILGDNDNNNNNNNNNNVTYVAQIQLTAGRVAENSTRRDHDGCDDVKHSNDHLSTSTP